MTCFVVILTAVPASNSRPALAETVPAAAARLGCSGCGTDSYPQSWVWEVNPAVRCLVKMPGYGYLTVFDNSTFTDNGKNTLKTEQNCRTVPVCNVGMGQTAVPCTCEPFFFKDFLSSCCCSL